MDLENYKKKAAVLDMQDILEMYQSKFVLPHKIHCKAYLCGHSLGLMPRDVIRRFDEMLMQWAEYAVEIGRAHV